MSSTISSYHTSAQRSLPEHIMYLSGPSVRACDPNAQYTPPTSTRRNCRVASRRRCEHEFATSWRQFRRVVGVYTPVGSRELGNGRRLRCAFASPNPSAVVANSCTHRRRRRDATKQFRRVGGVYWAKGSAKVQRHEQSRRTRVRRTVDCVE